LNLAIFALHEFEQDDIEINEEKSAASFCPQVALGSIGHSYILQTFI
jgi:hypothetical protein